MYTPEHLGLSDILIAGGKIEAIAPAGQLGFGYAGAQTVDAGGRKVVPGLIDLHVHVTGGGGEQGFASRVPESRMEDIAATGVTTVLGLLGTDGITRSLENLYAKVQALNEEGITAYMLTGSYSLPSVTLTGSVERDIALIEPCIGVKLALSDHRSSHPSVRMLTDVSAAARMGGLISGKKGLVTIHMGSGDGGLKPLFEMLKESDLPVGNLLPTHIGRTNALFADGLELVAMGGNIDLTGGNGKAAQRIYEAAEKGADLRKITVSSDGNGSQPKFDAEGNCIGLGWTGTGVLMEELQALVRGGMPLEKALTFFTVNAANRMGLSESKGQILPGMDADLVVLEDECSVFGVFARGKKLRWEREQLIKGYFC